MRIRRIITSLIAAVLPVGCAPSSASIRAGAADRFFSGDFPAARDAVRADARRIPYHENTVLASAMLGMASLADGDLTEANWALRQAYTLLESGNLNDEARILAAAIFWEGVTIWKGEPFEQAMTYEALAAAAALAGDWENVRIAARASTRRLKDFAEAREGGAEEITFVESDFALGCLLEGLAERHLGEPTKASEALARAARINPALEPLTSTINRGDYNTILIVHAGRGPRKQAVGEDGVSTEFFVRDGSPSGPLRVRWPGNEAAFPPAADIERMSRDHRWINLHDARRLKSALGSAMVIGGGVVASSADSDTNAIIGLGLLLGGIVTKALARADTRFNEFLPARVFVAALNVSSARSGEASGDLSIQLVGSGGGRAEHVIPGFIPGTPEHPRVVFIQLVSEPAYGVPDQPGVARILQHPNDVEPPRPGDYPWILGGRCVAVPTEQVMAAYHAGGYLTDMTAEDLLRLYRLEGIHPGSGPAEASSRRHADYRHILEGGDALFTPAYGTAGYKRLMYTPHAPYRPKSREVARLAASIASGEGHARSQSLSISEHPSASSAP